mgnify:CR=1 FL=1
MSDTDTWGRLKRAQDAYKAYWREQVGPMLGYEGDEGDDFRSYAEQALRIEDATVRLTYVRHSIHLLDANIEHHRYKATLLPLPTRSPVAPVVVALVVAALAYGSGGPVLALLGAALGYLVGYNMAGSTMKAELREVETHNEMVPEWKPTIEEWEQEVAELRAAEGRPSL